MNLPRKLVILLFILALAGGGGGVYLFLRSQKQTQTAGPYSLSEQVTLGTLLLAPFDGILNSSEKLESGYFLVFRSADESIILEMTFPAEEVFDKEVKIMEKGDLLARLGEGTLEVKIAKGNFKIVPEDLLLKIID